MTSARSFRLSQMSACRVAVSTFIAVACSTPTYAQTETNYPSRPLRLIVPFAPGGTTDTIARLVARDITKSLGQSIVVENRTGAGGLIGAEAALKLPADGYTLLFASISTLAIQPLVQSKPSYDPVRDFALVTQLATLPYIIAAHPSLPVHSVPQLVKLARAKPAAISFGSPGYGTGAHLTAEYLSGIAGVKLVHVPYKGDAPGTIDLIAGQIATAVFPPMTLLPHVKAGRVRALAVTSSERTNAMPDTPTVAESGYPGFESGSWNGIAVRAGTPEAIIKRLHKDIATTLAENQQVRSNIESSGSKVVGNTPEEFGAYVRGEIAKWRSVIAKAGIKIE
ncbi:MAG TPA: tripartite tricarboxylate transporter substrate binding protein [Burkholderiales bacterium]|nr:tripartite tricarboxylate transporter substrate binding protein [Burkholderiales bacterium]